MSWVCKYCSTNNDDADEKCMVCDTPRSFTLTRTLTVKRVQCLGLKGDVVVPEEYNIIGEEAFKNRHDITSVRLHGNVRKIMREAFSGCVSLREVYCEATLNSIGSKAFYDCRALTADKRPTAKTVQGDAFGCTPVAPPATPRATAPAPSAYSSGRPSTPPSRPYTDSGSSKPSEDSRKNAFKWFARFLIIGAAVGAVIALIVQLI